MSQILIDETKKAIGYTEEQKKCEDCKYAEEWEDQGGLWNWSCSYNNVCSFCERSTLTAISLKNELIHN